MDTGLDTDLKPDTDSNSDTDMNLDMDTNTNRFDIEAYRTHRSTGQWQTALLSSQDYVYI